MPGIVARNSVGVGGRKPTQGFHTLTVGVLDEKDSLIGSPPGTAAYLQVYLACEEGDLRLIPQGNAGTGGSYPSSQPGSAVFLLCEDHKAA